MQSRSRDAAPRSSSPRCSRSASRPRTSSRTPRAGERRRSARSTACREPASGSCCAASRRPSSSSDSEGISPRPSVQQPTAATRRCASSRMPPAPAATTARDAAETHGQAAERARHAHARVAVYERRLAADAQSRLAELRAERGGVETALAGATGGQEGANRRLVALGAARERLGLRQESAATLVETLTAELEEARAIARRGGPDTGRARSAGERGDRCGPGGGNGARRRRGAVAVGQGAAAGARERDRRA